MYQGLRKRTKPKAVLLGTAVVLATALLVVVYVSFLNYRSGLAERLAVAADLRLTAVQTALAEAEADAQIFARAFCELHGENGISSEMDAFAEVFLTQYQHYFQARVLDSSGQEIRKWSWDGTKVAASDVLQDKSDRYYYWEGLKPAPGRSYLSRVDYNQEQGALEFPLRPTVRSVARFDYTDQDHDWGYIVVLNMDLSSVLDSVRDEDTSIWAKNGKEALEAFQQGSFDVVVTGLMMPELDGLGLIKALRADVGCDLPVIAVTVAVIGEETDELIRSGASDVISKPISVDKLSESLAKHLKRKVG